MKWMIPLLIVLMLPIASNAQIMSKRRLATQNEIISLKFSVDLKEVLWYISIPIEMEREILVTKDVDMESLRAKGKVKISGGKVYELAKFPFNSSALFEFEKDDIIAVRFEHGEERYLKFKLEPASKTTDVRYYDLQYTEEGHTKKVMYGGSEWTLLTSSYARLEYKAKGNMDSKTKKTKVRGLKKDGSERKGVIGTVKDKL